MKKLLMGIAVVSMALAVGCKGGEKAKPAAAPAAKKESPYKVGTGVAAPWGGSLYHGTVKAVKGDSLDVLYTDDKQTRTVKIAECKLVPKKTWKVGDKVMAVWSSGKFYAGAVTAAKGATYTVKWDDGSAPKDVPAHLIMAR